MSKPIYVIGHRNPDTDSICSSIAYAWMKTAQGFAAVPARAGKINPETRYVLDFFQVDVPLLISDLFPRGRDIMIPADAVAHPDDTMRDIGRMLAGGKIKSIPVVDRGNNLVGIISSGDLAKRYYEELTMQDLAQAKVTYNGIVHALEGTVICGDTGGFISGKVKIAAAKSSSMATTLAPGDAVLVGDRTQAQLACINRGVACLIITGNRGYDERVIRHAEQNKVIVITTPYDTYSSARLIHQSIPVQWVMQPEVLSFSPSDLVSEIKNTILTTNYRVYPITERGKLKGIVNRDRLIMPEREKVILVDHNERSQAVEGIEEASILEIIDHHRLGGLETGEPIYIRHEPVGSTATIIANMYWHRSIAMSYEIAGILLAAIISDTLLFKSPTATAYDKNTAEKLAAVTQLNIHDFGMGMLKAGSAANRLSALDIIKNDLKEFVVGEVKFAIGQISVMDADPMLDMKAELHQALGKVLAAEQYTMVFLMITEILHENTYLLFAGSSQSVLTQAFGDSGQDGVLFLPGVMSRKKQVVPRIVEAVK